MENSKNWIKEERKIDNFGEIREVLDENEAKEVELVETFLDFDENFEKAFEIIEKSGKSDSFIFKCLEYFIKIRPHKVKSIFSLFKFAATKKDYKYYEITDKTLYKMLICDGIVPNDVGLEVNETLDDLFKMFPEGSLERAMYDDDVDLFLQLSTKTGFDVQLKYSVSNETGIYSVRGDDQITILQFMAFFGASNCFKRAFLSGLYPKENLNKYAIAGGNYEIIMLLKEESPDYYDACFETSIKFHHYEISDWLLQNYRCENVCQTSCLCYYNFLALRFFQTNEIDVAPPNLGDCINDEIDKFSLIGTRYYIEKLGVNANEEDTEKDTCLHYAAVFGDLNIVQYLNEQCGCDVKQRDVNGKAPIHYAAMQGDIFIVKYLVEKCGCDPKEKDNSNVSALFYAAQIGDFSSIRYLIEFCKCDPNEKSTDGCTVLHRAAGSGNIDAVKYLVEKCGCDPKEKDNRNNSSLSFSVASGNLSVVKYFVEEYGCDPKEKNTINQNSLHRAVLYRNLEIVKYLTENSKGDLNEQDEDGKTPLDIAVNQRILDIEQYLKSILQKEKH